MVLDALTEERDTRRLNAFKRLAIIVEVLLRVHGPLHHFQCRHGALVDLFPRALQPADSGLIQAGRQSNH